jgi:homopolymeric O-antigen transport system ATP-binding protein
MSSELAVVAEGLGKRFQLGEGQSMYRYRSLREELAGAARRRGKRRNADMLWALRDVSFELGIGETIGIIGRNGAGKTTLLKLLARITPPTTGRATIRGRVGSLLEVGTGFHPELTGRENIMLSGAVMGMRRSEVLQRFDEIVEFSGLARFLDSPVKRYSSGQYMRLAFSVAAHLEPDVLLVDEVLAVGDAEFQKKCLGRMSELTTAGRTVLFVSHSMPTIFRLCPRVILLDRGGVVADGDSGAVVATYLSSGLGSSAQRVWEDPAEAPGDGIVRLRAVRVLSESGQVVEEIDARQRFAVEVEYELLDADSGLRPVANLHFFNDQGVCLFISGDHVNRDWYDTERQPGAVRATCWVPGDLLNEGRVTVLAAVSSFDPTVVHAREDDAVSFMVVDKGIDGGARGVFARDLPGAVRPLLEWEVENGARPALSRRGART